MVVAPAAPLSSVTLTTIRTRVDSVTAVAVAPGDAGAVGTVVMVRFPPCFRPGPTGEGSHPDFSGSDWAVTPSADWRCPTRT